jgi:hypothetical protein
VDEAPVLSGLIRCPWFVQLPVHRDHHLLGFLFNSFPAFCLAILAAVELSINPRATDKGSMLA